MEEQTGMEQTGERRTAHTVTVRNLILGNGRPKICVPAVAGSREELADALLRIRGARDLYDMVEFRADFYPPEQADTIPELLEMVREAAGDKPVLYTFRTREEGGKRSVPPEIYREQNIRAAESGADLVDLQLGMVREDEDRLIGRVQAAGAKVILSFHDFRGTPPADELVKKLVEMQTLGADITKAAVMPRDREDVLELLFASVQMRESWADRPFITMSMGSLGAVTRICGSFSGSCMTFGTVGAASAPGQIPAERLREAVMAFEQA